MQKSAITDAKERIDSVKDEDGVELVRERKKARQALQEAGRHLQEIATHRDVGENRIFGELAWSPPIVLYTKPGQYTQDLAVIKIDTGMLDDKSYRSNTVNIGTRSVCTQPARRPSNSPLTAS